MAGKRNWTRIARREDVKSELRALAVRRKIGLLHHETLSDGDVLSGLLREELRAQVLSAIGKLSARQRKALELTVAFGPRREYLTLRAAGLALGVHGESVRQMVVRAERKLVLLLKGYVGYWPKGREWEWYA